MSSRRTTKVVPATQPKLVRCAIYTRKSTDEGLELEFNSLDAQRESGEAYVAAQKHEGWVCMPDRYDDGGYSGGNIERPALQRLLRDIEAGKVDCVVVYKVDRLSRSLMDFARVMQVFDGRGVTFVSVTQQFNTTHSMGRLTLNILLSFAQFEREIISERTRDKIAAARRKGKFAGGKPLLGYDIVSSQAGSKLVVNEDEARNVRKIYELYAEHQSLIPTVRELHRRGWANKVWVTRKGRSMGGSPFDKGTLYKLLTSKTYLGLVTHGQQVYPGEHPAIVDKSLWERANGILKRNRRTGGAPVRNKHGALLRGLLSCGCCKAGMMHTYTIKGEGKRGAGVRYRYYVCVQAQKRGWDVCATKSVPAGQIERFVVEQIAKVGRDPRLLEVTLEQMRQQHEREIAELVDEQKTLAKELGKLHTRLHASAGGASDPSLADRIRVAERRQTEVQEALLRLRAERVDDGDVATALAEFEPVWRQLGPKEQERVVRLLVEKVEYDGAAGTVAVTFRPTGIKALAQEQTEAA